MSVVNAKIGHGEWSTAQDVQFADRHRSADAFGEVLRSQPASDGVARMRHLRQGVDQIAAGRRPKADGAGRAHNAKTERPRDEAGRNDHMRHDGQQPPPPGAPPRIGSSYADDGDDPQKQALIDLISEGPVKIGDVMRSLHIGQPKAVRLLNELIDDGLVVEGPPLGTAWSTYWPTLSASLGEVRDPQKRLARCVDDAADYVRAFLDDRGRFPRTAEIAGSQQLAGALLDFVLMRLQQTGVLTKEAVGRLGAEIDPTLNESLSVQQRILSVLSQGPASEPELLRKLNFGKQVKLAPMLEAMKRDGLVSQTTVPSRTGDLYWPTDMDRREAIKQVWRAMLRDLDERQPHSIADLAERNGFTESIVAITLDRMARSWLVAEQPDGQGYIALKGAPPPRHQRVIDVMRRDWLTLDEIAFRLGGKTKLKARRYVLDLEHRGLVESRKSGAAARQYHVIGR